MARPHVPKFGNWESEENVPYTVYFDKARKGRTGNGGKMINPNDPQENPDMFPTAEPPAEAPPSRLREEPIGGRGTIKPTHERRVSKEDGDHRQFTDSPARNDNVGRKPANEPSTYQRPGGRGANPSRPSRPSGGSEYSFERSPLHPQHQARAAGRGSASPAWEGNKSYDSSHGTPGRSRMKPVTRGDESPNRGAAVPKFGDWDEKNPSAADSYTHIFNRVREERNAGSPAVGLGTDSKPSYANPQKQKPANDSSMVCCFPWGRK